MAAIAYAFKVEGLIYTMAAKSNASGGSGSQTNLAIIAVVLLVIAIVALGMFFKKSVNGGLTEEEMNKVAKPLVLPGPGKGTSPAPLTPPGGTSTPSLPMGSGPTGVPPPPPK